jgi:putative ATP-binding cassette transporter
VSAEVDDEQREASVRKARIRCFSRSALAYWSAGGGVTAWPLAGGLLAVIVLGVGAAYAMNVWNRAIFDALQQNDAKRVGWLSLLYFALLAASVGFALVLVYVRMTLQRRWRVWLSNKIIDRWLTGGRYYQLNLVSGDHANPEARIVDDIRIATESPVDFVSGIVQALLSAITFIIVLWTIGGALDINLGSARLQVPGFLVVAALLYALIASGAMVLIGHRFVHASEQKNQAEAEFRYVLTRLRENGESIALSRGEEEERAGVARAIQAVRASWLDIAFQTLKTTAVSQTSSFIAPVLPIILCAPKLLAGTMTLGEVMQAASAFTIVQAAFNWLVDNYPKMADWSASASRIGALIAALDALDAAENEEAGAHRNPRGPGGAGAPSR